MEMQRLIKNPILLCPHVGVPREDHRFVIFSVSLCFPLAPVKHLGWIHLLFLSMPSREWLPASDNENH